MSKHSSIMKRHRFWNLTNIIFQISRPTHAPVCGQAVNRCVTVDLSVHTLQYDEQQKTLLRKHLQNLELQTLQNVSALSQVHRFRTDIHTVCVQYIYIYTYIFLIALLLHKILTEASRIQSETSVRCCHDNNSQVIIFIVIFKKATFRLFTSFFVKQLIFLWVL